MPRKAANKKKVAEEVEVTEIAIENEDYMDNEGEEFEQEVETVIDTPAADAAAAVNGDGPNDANNLIVNYLPSDMVEGELKMLFDPYGKVKSVKIIRNMMTQESMGYGFVEMSSDAECERAMPGLTSLKIRGKTLKVSRAIRKEDKEDKQQHHNLYVSNFPKSFSQEDVQNLFAGMSDIVEAKVMIDSLTKMNKGFGFVKMASKEDCEKAIVTMNGHTTTEGALVVKFADNKPKSRLQKQQNRFNPYGKPDDKGMQNYGQQYNMQQGGYGQGGYGGYAAAAYGQQMGAYGQQAAMPGYGQQVAYGQQATAAMYGQYDQAAYAQQYAAYGQMAGQMGMGQQQGGYSAAAQAAAAASLYCLFVYHLTADCTEKLLFDLFSQYGSVASVKIVKQEDGTPKGFAFINMEDYNQAQLAVESLNGYRLGKKYLQVSFKKTK
jgi:ELAV/HuD family splicing factor